MKFYKNLYMGDTITRPEKVKWKLKHHIGQLNLFVIAFAEGNDQLEFYHCSFLRQAYCKKNPPYIVGIAAGYQEAAAIVERIAAECYEATRTCNLKEYLFLK